MTKLFLIATGALLSIAATAPVAARDARPAPDASAAKTSEAPTSATPHVRYCVIDTPTGSRIDRKVCKTRDEWLKEGFDPLAKD